MHTVSATPKRNGQTLLSTKSHRDLGVDRLRSQNEIAVPDPILQGQRNSQIALKPAKEMSRQNTHLRTYDGSQDV